MQASDHRRSVSIVALFIAVAIFGYVLGHDRARVASGPKSRSIFAARVLLTYPSGWRQASAAPKIPGLSIANQIVLAPGGDAAQAGLVTGQLPTAEPGPLPRGFMADTRQFPNTEVVDLPETQAYRYAQLSAPGFDRTLRLYVVPSPGSDPTILACYASASFSAYMRACEQIVARLTLLSQPSSYDLVPEPSYVRRLSAWVGALDAQRVALRHAIRYGARPETVQRLATSLAAAFADAAGSLAHLEPPVAASQEQAALADPLLRARDAYTALAAAAVAENPYRAATASRQVNAAETSINMALESFALLGYRA